MNEALKDYMTNIFKSTFDREDSNDGIKITMTYLKCGDAVADEAKKIAIAYQKFHDENYHDFQHMDDTEFKDDKLFDLFLTEYLK